MQKGAIEKLEAVLGGSPSPTRVMRDLARVDFRWLGQDISFPVRERRHLWILPLSLG